MPESVFRYFPSLSADQREKIIHLKPLYDHWNKMINVISRKDMENFYTHHVLHSLSIAKIINFNDGTHILDVGTGGGFPGIPLAILFPKVKFYLLDSVEKKIKVVRSVSEELGLDNVEAIRKRAEEEKGKYDFIISRAVTDFGSFVKLVKKNIQPVGINSLKNGIIYLKGGDIEGEIAPFRDNVKIWSIGDFFPEPFFGTKKIIYFCVL